MSIKFTLTHRLLATLVIISSLLVATTGVYAKNGESSASTVGRGNTSALGEATPPPLGPPAPRNPIRDLSATLLTYGTKKGPVDVNDPNEVKGLEDKIQEAVDAVNVKIKADEDMTGVRAKVSWSFYYIGGPGMAITSYEDHPNERYAEIPYILDFFIYDIQKHTGSGWISIPVTRHISQSVDFQVFCNHWQTQKGQLKFIVKAEPPYLEDDQGTLEDIVDFFLNGHLTNYINSLVRERLSAFSVDIIMEAEDENPQCDALGSYNDPLSEKWDTISWSYHPRLVLPTGYNTISIKLTGIKRLNAHNLHGAILYNEMEAPALEIYANYQHRYIQLPTLLEGQQASINSPAMIVDKPDNAGLLVVIATIHLGSSSNPLQDSSFKVFGSNVNFGRGSQSLTISKSYLIQADPKSGAKPTKWFVPGYELLFKVSAQVVNSP